MNFFQVAGQKVYVDSDGSCPYHHGRHDPPLFHVVRSPKSTPYLLRCPKSLTAEEKKRLKEEK